MTDDAKPPASPLLGRKISAAAVVAVGKARALRALQLAMNLSLGREMGARKPDAHLPAEEARIEMLDPEDPLHAALANLTWAQMQKLLPDPNSLHKPSRSGSSETASELNGLLLTLDWDGGGPAHSGQVRLVRTRNGFYVHEEDERRGPFRAIEDALACSCFHYWRTPNPHLRCSAWLAQSPELLNAAFDLAGEFGGTVTVNGLPYRRGHEGLKTLQS